LQKNFIIRKQPRNDLDELVAELDIAKGTLYKHFRSKNELLLELIIQNEKEISKFQKNITLISKNMRLVMLYHLTSPSRTILLHQLEEHLTMTESSSNICSMSFMQFANSVFSLKDMTEKYLKSQNYDMSIRDYFLIFGL
jgi:AcrR family transcriptional regulator